MFYSRVKTCLYAWFQSVYNSFLSVSLPSRGTVDAEIKVPSVENPYLTSYLPLKLGVGHSIATPISPTARNFFYSGSIHFPLF